MSLPEGVAVNFGVYTLACHELLNRLGDLHAATLMNRRLPCEICCQRFDEALRQLFYEFGASDLKHSAEQFGNYLHAKASSIIDYNRKAAEIFDAIVVSIQDKAVGWDYHTDIENLHSQGRNLARLFFEPSPWQETQGRLGKECHLIFSNDIISSEGKRTCVAYPMDHHLAPLAYWPKYPDDERNKTYTDAIIHRFTYETGFACYLAYPFLFLHEYTAHLYAIDNRKNDIFNDGWMIYAVEAFMTKEWKKTPSHFGLIEDQISIAGSSGQGSKP